MTWQANSRLTGRGSFERFKYDDAMTAPVMEFGVTAPPLGSEGAVTLEGSKIRDGLMMWSWPGPPSAGRPQSRVVMLRCALLRARASRKRAMWARIA